MIKDYRDLMVWQKGRKLAVEVYQLTKPFPKSERKRSLSTKLVISIFLLFTALFTNIAYANNIQMSSVELKNLTLGEPTADIEFDISWDNSWRYGDTFYDAAWVFVKYSVNDTAWQHATISGTTSIGSGTGLSIDVPLDNKGAFLYRSSADSGTLSTTNVQLQWNRQADGVAYNAAKIEIRVFAIEMVYIARGPFYVGDTDNDNTNCFFRADGTYVKDEALGPYQITSEDAITVGTADGNLYYDVDNDYSGDQSGPIPAGFPKGYNTFYIMKYEISQGQYSDFLNTLTQAEQNARTYDTLTAEDAAGHYVMIEQDITSVTYRQAIKAGADPVDGQPYWFGCDLDGDGILNEANDGQWIACGSLTVMDGMAYADWAALRPMTELEFEKAARGPSAVVDDEYVWRNSTVESATSVLTNAGEAGETANQGNLNYSSCSPDGPYRCGIYADSASSRQNAGASFYGVMELSGSLWERPVTVGNATGRGFTGTHGDGVLSSGSANNSDWPGYGVGANGSGLRGGQYELGPELTRILDRYYAAHTRTNRYYTYGGRCVRTSP